MGEIDNGDIERILQQLTPRGAPGELRQRTLSRIQSEAKRSATNAPSVGVLSGCLVRVVDIVGITNVAVAASVLVATIAFFGSVAVQEDRILALLGPSPTSNRVDEIMETIRYVVNAEDLEPLREQLALALVSANRRREVLPLRYLMSSELLTTMGSSGNDKVEANRANPGRSLGDTTLDRHRPQLEIARTA